MSASTPPTSGDDGGATGSTTQLAFTGTDVVQSSLLALIALVLGSTLLLGNRFLAARRLASVEAETSLDWPKHD